MRPDHKKHVKKTEKHNAKRKDVKFALEDHLDSYEMQFHHKDDLYLVQRKKQFKATYREHKCRLNIGVFMVSVIICAYFVQLQLYDTYLND